jgi:hypothetical protein
MPIKFATWMHGNGAMPEFTPMTQRRMAGSSVFGATDLTTNFFHFPVTTPVIIDGVRPLLARAFVLYRMRFCTVRSVQLWSGRERKFVFNVTQESGLTRDHPDVLRAQFEEGKTMFNLAERFSEPLEILQGLSITVRVDFDSRITMQLPNGTFQTVGQNMGAIEFFSAGVDWE